MIRPFDADTGATAQNEGKIAMTTRGDTRQTV
jgi:hypothetical protein